MAFLLNKATTFSRFRSSSQKTSDQFLQQSRRRFHIEPKARKKALLEEDPDLKQLLGEDDLKRYKSLKKTVYRLKRGLEVLGIALFAGCCYGMYEIYVITEVMREEARKQAKTTTEGA